MFRRERILGWTSHPVTRSAAASLEHIRSRYPSYTEWFEKDLPWGEIDGVEVTRIAR